LATVISVPGFAPAAEDRSNLDKRRTPIVEAYERARDSVANISTTQKVEVRGYGIFGDLFSMPTERASVGSAVVIHEDGYLATNAHVVSAAVQLTASFADGTSYEAQIVGLDEARDLAVIKIEPVKPLTPIAWGRSDDLMIGELTIAVGNPVGLQNTVTTGIISAMHRELTVGGRVVYHDVIQTDASINPGNSGGPLLNVLGELIGINTAIRTDAQNIGFAIPVDQLLELLPDILDAEKRNKVQVGLKVGDSLPPKVVSIREGSPADKAGVRLGDIVDMVDGRRIRGPVDFYVSMLAKEPGDAVSLRLVREGAPASAKLSLVPVPKPDGKLMARRHLGLSIANLKDKAARRFAWQGPGVIVEAVEPQSPAAREDIRPGDLLVSMGRYWVTDVDDVGSLLSGITEGSPVEMAIRRAVPGGLIHGRVRLYAR
jgi:serine protease Do